MIDAEFDLTSEAWRDAETAAYKEGPWTDALGFRSFIYLLALGMTVFSYGWRVLAMFFIGASLMKLDFFATERRAWHRRFCLVGLGVGLPLELANAWLTYVATPAERVDLAFAGAAGHELGSVFVCLGLVGAAALVVAGGGVRPIVTGLACTGRLALSNYLLQTIVATGLMYWWGLGWFGDVSRVQQIGLVVAIFIAQTLASVLWLRMFRIGPLEWIWRSLTYLKRQPFRR